MLLRDNNFVDEMEEYFDRLWPICRSITGKGLRDSFAILKELIPLNLHEVPSRSSVFDWRIPDEWNIKDAYIVTPEGKKIADFSNNNLHVVNYSTPVDREMTFKELDKHLYTKEELPDSIPYVTSYYKRTWGFCLDYNTYNKLSREGLYKVKINSSLEKGSLTYGTLLLEGSSKEEILYSSYLCHPSMANNELSGPLALSFLYKEIKKIKNRRFSYRFVIAPETIGTLCFLKDHKEELLTNLHAGFVLTCCGDKGNITFKSTREENTHTNKVTEHVLTYTQESYKTLPFDPIGSDERQYGSPGFNLPVGTLMRTPFSKFKEYHTSKDSKDLISFEKLNSFVGACLGIVKAFEINQKYENQIKFGEPFLGKRNLFDELETKLSHSEVLKRRLRLLNYLDGSRSLIDVCDRYGYNILDVEGEINQLLEHKLIK